MHITVDKKALETEIEIMQKEIVYLKGKRREKAINAYKRLVIYQLREPIFLKRSD